MERINASISVLASDKNSMINGRMQSEIMCARENDIQITNNKSEEPAFEELPHTENPGMPIYPLMDLCMTMLLKLHYTFFDLAVHLHFGKTGDIHLASSV